MTDRLELTQTQQSAAIDRAGENIALRSGAGCGKTLVLGRRFTELLIKYRGEENPLNKFVALTFTDKAAMEMTQRVRSLISERASQSKAGRADQHKLRSWLEELPNARISTIHSFCASLLRSWAIEAGIDPNFAVCANDYVADSMLIEAVDKAVLQAVEAGREDVATLLTRISYKNAAELVSTLVDKRLDWNAADYADHGAILARWQQKLDDGRQETLAALADGELSGRLDEIEAIPCSKDDDKLNIWRNEMLSAARRIIASTADATAEDFSRLPDPPGSIGAPTVWGGRESLTEARNRMKAVLESLSDCAGLFAGTGELDTQAAESLATLVSLACDANNHYTAAKRQRGLLDFTDLLQHANRLIFGRPDMVASLRKQIDQLLIDECQDTNAFQVRMLLKLMFGDAEPTAADGKLFLVGDAKQSIYRFRGAQVEVFEELCRKLGQDKQEDLDISFRTHEAGVEFVNHLFERLMPGYTPIRAFRKQTPSQPSVEIILAEPDGKDEKIVSAYQAASLQAAVTARRIREMLDGGERIVWDESAGDWRAVQPRDIAILFSRRTNSLLYERELAAHSVPYYVLAGTGFFKQQEVYDMLNALRVIDNPFDDIALFGVLRSGMFGLDDNTLMHIAEACSPPYLPSLAEADLAGKLNEARQRSLRFAVDLLGSLHRKKDAVDMGELAGHLLRATGYEAVLLSQFEGKRRLGNVRKLVEMAREASAGGLALAEFITQTDEIILHESRYEQASVAGEHENVVRIMTIHKAKGLEFPVVFVPDLNAQRRGHRDMLLNRLDWGLTLKLKADNNDDDEDDNKKKKKDDLPLSFRMAKALEDRDQLNEDIRAMYVAATRHKDFLVFVGANWRTKDGLFCKGKNNSLRQIDEAIGVGDAGKDISYADGRFSAAVKRMSPKPPSPLRGDGGKKKLPLQKASSGESLAAELIASAVAAAAPPLLGALNPQAGKVQLAVTALGDFEHCPMLYRWRYDLKVPTRLLDGQVRHSGGTFDALTLGTLYHRCMELLDVDSPQTAAALLRLAAADMHIEDTGRALSLAEELEAILSNFRSHPLCDQLRQAKQTFRELDFVLDCGAATLRGQIDLIFQDPAGNWHIVDYKSDRVAANDVAAHAQRYKLQMLLYCLAAAKYLDVPPAEARLYFLRSGLTHTFKISPETLATAESHAAGLAERLIAAGRAGDFPAISSGVCNHCPYGKLCKVNS